MGLWTFISMTATFRTMTASEKYKAEFSLVPIYIAWGFVIFLACLIGGSWLFVELSDGNDPVPAWAIFLSGVLFFIPFLLLNIAIVKKTFATVFDDNYEVKTSFISKRVRRIEGSKIESVDFHESVIGRGRWGSVTVRGTGIRALIIGGVKNPEKMAEAIRSIASSSNSKSNSSDNTNVASSLTELNRLMIDGVISKEDFEKAKSKILGI
jgi:hypothetical protein